MRHHILLIIASAALVTAPASARIYHVTAMLDQTGHAQLDMPDLFNYPYLLVVTPSEPVDLSVSYTYDTETITCGHHDLYCQHATDVIVPHAYTEEAYTRGGLAFIGLGPPERQGLYKTSGYPDFAYFGSYNYKFELNFLGAANTTVTLSGYATSVPDPSVWITLTAGLAGVGTAMRRMRRRVARSANQPITCGEVTA